MNNLTWEARSMCKVSSGSEIWACRILRSSANFWCAVANYAVLASNASWSLWRGVLSYCIETGEAAWFTCPSTSLVICMVQTWTGIEYALNGLDNKNPYERACLFSSWIRTRYICLRIRLGRLIGTFVSNDSIKVRSKKLASDLLSFRGMRILCTTSKYNLWREDISLCKTCLYWANVGWPENFHLSITQENKLD